MLSQLLVFDRSKNFTSRGQILMPPNVSVNRYPYTGSALLPVTKFVRWKQSITYTDQGYEKKVQKTHIYSRVVSTKYWVPRCVFLWLWMRIRLHSQGNTHKFKMLRGKNKHRVNINTSSIKDGDCWCEADSNIQRPTHKDMIPSWRCTTEWL